MLQYGRYVVFKLKLKKEFRDPIFYIIKSFFIIFWKLFAILKILWTWRFHSNSSYVIIYNILLRPQNFSRTHTYCFVLRDVVNYRTSIINIPFWKFFSPPIWNYFYWTTLHLIYFTAFELYFSKQNCAGVCSTL